MNLLNTVKKNNWSVVDTITEKKSGSKKSRQRPAIDKLFKSVTKHRAKKVAVSEVSRFGRNTIESLKDIERLKFKGIKMIKKP